MIRRFSISVFRYIKNELPAHLRGYPDLLALFRGLLYPFKIIADEWKAFRELSITRARVSDETASLEWYLNQLFDPTTRGITIDTAGVSGVPAGDKIAESGIFFIAGDQTAEPTLFTAIGIKGEGTVYNGRSFCVFVPTVVAASDDDIIGIVNQYRFAGKTFLIKRT